MKKVVANVVVIVLASLYLMAMAVQQACKEMTPYLGTVSLIRCAVFIGVSVVGFGLFGVLMAVMK